MQGEYLAAPLQANSNSISNRCPQHLRHRAGFEIIANQGAVLRRHKGLISTYFHQQSNSVPQIPTPETWYTRTQVAAPTRPPLQGAHDTEVCIVGAGLAGLSTALELLRRGQSVTLLESQTVGWGASGRNGGFVLGGYAEGLDALEKRLGMDHARELFSLSLEGVRAVRDNIDQLQLPGCDTTPGELSVRRHPARDDLLRHCEHMARHYDYLLALIEREPLREMLRSERYHQALYDDHGFHFHPLNYCLGLAAEIERLGGKIFEHSPMRRHDLKGAQRRITTEGGEVLAKELVLCGGGYAGPAFARVHRSYLPVATYVIVTEPLGGRLKDAVRSPAAIMDDRRAGDYYRIVDGDRLLWGGRITASTRDPADLAERMRDDLLDVYPQFEGVRVELAWSGLMAYARHKMPMISQLAEGLWVNAGFGGHGMNTAPIAGRVVAEGICGDSDRHRLFAPFGLQWNGGPFGPLAANLVYAGLRLQDWWREC